MTILSQDCVLIQTTVQLSSMRRYLDIYNLHNRFYVDERATSRAYGSRYLLHDMLLYHAYVALEHLCFIVIP